MAKALVTGASGLLGAHLMASLSRQHEVVGLDRHPWWGDAPLKVHVDDLRDAEAIRRVVESEAPDILIHCAALTDLETCEREPKRAYAANAALTCHVVRAAPAGCLVVYISSDGVLSGETSCATEEQLPRPRTVYGRTKMCGEWETAEATDNHLIVRTNFFGWSSGRKRTAGEWLYRSLETKEPVTLFTDFFFTPIYVVDLVERLTRLLGSAHRGVIHVGGADRISKHAFGALLAEVGGFVPDSIGAGSLDQSPSIVKRPKDISLNSAQCAQLTGLSAPECRAGVARFLADRGRPLSARIAAPAASGARAA